MEYFYCKLNDVSFRTDTPERKAFYAHIQKVAEALHDIEWVDSGDYGPGDENKAILACIGHEEILRSQLDHISAALSVLSIEIKRAELIAKPLVTKAKP